MLRSIYRLLLILSYPLVRVRLRWRARREPGYGERVDERFGYLGADLPRGAVWFHTVSAGETIAAVPLIQTLIDEFPEMLCFFKGLSTVTAGDQDEFLSTPASELVIVT